MKNTPVDYQTARKIIDGYGLPDFGKATIREVVAISTQLEQETKTEFIHMEMGVPGLTQRYGGGTFGTVYIHRVLYALSSGTSHSAQFALAAMFKAAADGTFDFISEVKEYGRRAERLKKIFTDYGFRIVYDHDLDEPIADGFYFTIAYPGMTGGELMEELIYYGVSAISLSTTGSNQEGLRACTSFIKPHQYALLEERLKLFKENHTA